MYVTLVPDFIALCRDVLENVDDWSLMEEACMFILLYATESQIVICLLPYVLFFLHIDMNDE